MRVETTAVDVADALRTTRALIRPQARVEEAVVYARLAGPSTPSVSESVDVFT